MASTSNIARFLLRMGRLLVPAIAGFGCAMAGTISNYNLYVLGNMNAANSDVEGALAVAGNATLSVYSVGLQTPHTGNNLVVGGDLTAFRVNSWGHTVVGGTVTDSGGNLLSLQPGGTPLPLDFPRNIGRIGEINLLEFHVRLVGMGDPNQTDVQEAKFGVH